MILIELIIDIDIVLVFVFQRHLAMAERLVFGIRLHCVRKIDEALDTAAGNSAEFVVVPLFHPRMRRDKITSSNRTGARTRSDRELSNNC